MNFIQTGFIAQEVEAQFPDLVSTHKWIDGTYRKFLNMGGLMPYTIGAIKELNIKIQGLSSLDINNSNSMGSLMKRFLGDVGNTIGDLFAKRIHTEELCVKKSDGTDICINGDRLEQLLNSQNPITSGGGGNPPPPTCTLPEVLNASGNGCSLPEDPTPPPTDPLTCAPPEVLNADSTDCINETSDESNIEGDVVPPVTSPEVPAL